MSRAQGQFAARAKPCSGRFRSPVSLAQRIRSSHRARRRCRSSRSASWPPLVLVARQVKRCPSMSVNRSCAPGCGRSFADDDPHPGRPGRQVQHAGDLRDPRALADLAAAVISRRPCCGRHGEDRVLDVGGDGEPDGIVQALAGAGEPGKEVMGAAGGVGADQHPAAQVAGQLGEGEPGGLDVVRGGVGAGVAGSQRDGQRFPGPSGP